MKRAHLPSGICFLIGVSIMFIVFRCIFLAEFGFEMDIISIAVPFFTLGIVFEYWNK